MNRRLTHPVPPRRTPRTGCAGPGRGARRSPGPGRRCAADEAPDRAALEDVLRRLGTDDPRAITRTGEARYRELGLADADRDTLLDALAAEPVLIERPIVVVGERAVVARPPERLLELLP